MWVDEEKKLLLSLSCYEGKIVATKCFFQIINNKGTKRDEYENALMPQINRKTGTRREVFIGVCIVGIFFFYHNPCTLILSEKMADV